MQRKEYGVLLSASDLMRFAGCAHATTLDLARMTGWGAAPGKDSEDAEFPQRHGDAHGARLGCLQAVGRSVVEIRRNCASPGALVLAAPRRLDAPCATVEEVRRVNALCALPVAGVSAAIGDAA